MLVHFHWQKTVDQQNELLASSESINTLLPILCMAAIEGEGGKCPSPLEFGKVNRDVGCIPELISPPSPQPHFLYKSLDCKYYEPYLVFQLSKHHMC